ncbi:hypothetical protein N7470_003164 [Penicillium chermesinum]|nr:hypothetical protein N7470_003164 [Penicillium chermesinum]
MQRPSYPPIYHTPQSNSPASVASQPHDQHGRSLYTQSPQMPQPMNAYPTYNPPLNPVQSSPYTHPPPQSHHPLTSQSMMMPPQTTTAQMSPHLPSHAPNTALSSSPTVKVDPSSQTSGPQRSMLNPVPGSASSGVPAGNIQQGSPMPGTSSSAAPGPIPATTPLVVRQDGNGVQWIAFEYSRDRVKMEYTIRCDVDKDQYKGNRLVYETECNAVGWALAELNPALRGKRGLIQRAVDSWRNSNQDVRLRSRRVRWQAKVHRRQSISAHTPHMATSSVGSAGNVLPGAGSLSRSSMGTYVYGSAAVEPTRLPPAPHGATDIRPAQAFDTQPVPPVSAGPGPSMAPLLRDNGLGPLSRQSTIATSSGISQPEADDETGPTNNDLFGALPDGKRRTFILVEDPQRGARVRVKVGLDKVKMDEIPDSYRKNNAVYPRTYFPIQMKDASVLVDPSKRFFADEQDQSADPEDSVVGRTSVPAPSLDGERNVDVPRLSRRRHRKEVLLNDLAYRLSWSQSRVFAGRMLFLQRSLDAYRNKMRTSMLAAGQDPSEMPEHFDTRRGKRRFLDRARRDVPTAAQRSAEEVDG